MTEHVGSGGGAVDDGALGERRSGRRPHPDDARTPYETDYARVVHSGSFRRLQGKTQILALGEDDFHRTRLTHSMEVAQVAEGIVQRLRAEGPPPSGPDPLPPAALIHAVGLSHDLGHPPFGHGGEAALDYCMRDHGGFEGNAQTLRILARLEPYVPGFGADLTRRAVIGVLKYPVPRAEVANPDSAPALAGGTTFAPVLDLAAGRPVKACYDEDADVLDWALAPFTPADRLVFGRTEARVGRHARTTGKSFDCSIMDAADDIAYGVHDLEDAIALGFVGETDFRRAIGPDACAVLLDALAARPLPGDGGSDFDGLMRRLFGSAADRKAVIGRLVHHFIRCVEVVTADGVAEPLLGRRARVRADARPLLDALQALVVAEVIDHPRVQQLEFKGRRMVVHVFEALSSDPRRLLPTEAWAAYDAAGRTPRAMADHVASLTDAGLVRTYDRLFSPRSGSVFDRV